MIRPFKDIKEFNAKIHKSIGSIIKLRYKTDPKQTLIGMITSFGPDADAIGIGSCIRYLSSIFNVYEYFDEDSAKWLPFGVEIPEETENKKNAKFKVGHMYKDADKNGVFMVTAKYTSPHDNKTYLISQRLSLHQIGQIICLIRKDENEDEFIDRYTVDYMPVKCSAKDEVEKIEKEIHLY